MPAARRISASKIVDLRAAGVTGVIIDWSIGLDGALTVLAAKEMPEYRRREEDEGMFFHGYSRRANEFAIHVVREGVATVLRLPRTKENFVTVRALPRGRFLLVRGRQWRGELVSGRIVDARGREVRRLRVGDLAQHVFVTSKGSLWLGFGDEVYGTPLPSGGGVTHMDLSGKVRFALNQARGSRGICMDCYAMTLNSDGTLFAHIYTDFPLVEIAPKHRVTVHKPFVIRGAKALAVRCDHAIFFGGYDDPFEISRINLRNRRRQRLQPVTVKGRRITPTEALGIDGVLYLRENDAIYALAVPGRDG